MPSDRGVRFLRAGNHDTSGSCRQRRRRGRNSSSRSMWLVGFNHSQWSTGRAFLERIRNKELLGGFPVVVGGQEHRLLAPACHTVQTSMLSDGWKLAFAPARATAAGGTLGTSGGASIAAPSHVDMQMQCPCEDWDISPIGGAGRIVAAWLPVLDGRGISFISAYFWCSEGWSYRNQDLMWSIIRLVRQLKGGLWALVADFNMEPSMLQAHPLFAELDGEILSPEQATCVSNGACRCYDYFVVAKPLKHLVEELCVLDGVASYPHSPAALRLSTKPPAMYRWVFQRPSRLAVDPPIGCSRQPPDWSPLPHRLESIEHATETWERISSLAEQEILDRHDLVGNQRGRASGYSHKPYWAQKQVLPHRAKERRFSLSAQLWRTAARRLREAWVLLYKHVYLPSRDHLVAPSLAALGQLTVVRKVLLNVGTQLDASGDVKFRGGHWGNIFKAAALCVPWSGYELVAIWNWYKDAEMIANNAQKEDLHKSQSAFRLVGSLASAAQASWLHRLSKEKVAWQTLRPKAGNVLFSPMDAAEDQRRIWADVWRHDDEPFQTQLRPWEHTPIETAADADMPPLTLDGFDKSCKAIKRRTGLGSDYFHLSNGYILAKLASNILWNFLAWSKAWVFGQFMLVVFSFTLFRKLRVGYALLGFWRA